MALSTASILKDGTVATTGGTAKAFTSLGTALNQHNLYFDGSDFLTRTAVEASVKQPKVSATAPNGYTQGRSKIVMKVPLVLDNGNTTINTLTIELSTDIETTDAEKETMLVAGAQLLHDSDFSEFWKQWSIA